MLSHCVPGITEQSVFHVLQARRAGPFVDVSKIMASEVGEVVGQEAEDSQSWANQKLNSMARQKIVKDKLSEMAKEVSVESAPPSTKHKSGK
eukprot:6821886-Lingulodinium_polyedra.AAC.1